MVGFQETPAPTVLDLCDSDVGEEDAEKNDVKVDDVKVDDVMKLFDELAVHLSTIYVFVFYRIFGQ